MEKITGTVERITFQSQENGWSVLRVRPTGSVAKKFPKDTLITVTLQRLQIFPGASFEFEGKWTQHANYGEQFHAHVATELKPADRAALERYLGSGLIKGIGPATAKLIIKKFGDDALNVFEHQLERLTEVKGISAKKLTSIKESWIKHQEMKELMLFLQQHLVSTLLAIKIYKFYGAKSVSVLKKNPYQLARDIYGIGFKTADDLAQKLGLSPQSKERYQAALLAALERAREEGHCYLKEEQVVQYVRELLRLEEQDAQELSLERLKAELEVLFQERYLMRYQQHQQYCYFALSLDRDENGLALQIKSRSQLAQFSTHDYRESVVELMRSWEQSVSKQDLVVILSEQQKQAIFRSLTSAVSVITGGPGCGKTTTLKSLVQLVRRRGQQVVLAAPTGRAAQRMSEVAGIAAQTIHRLLSFDPQSKGFKYKEGNPVPGDFFILDESSMVDITLASSFFRALPLNAQVVLVGDVDQLPAVGPGKVLRDLIDSQVVVVSYLTQVFRQAQESAIIKAAHQIRLGEFPALENPFEKPTLWSEGHQLLFFDAEEATKTQWEQIELGRELINKQVASDDTSQLALAQRWDLTADQWAQRLNHLRQASKPSEELMAVIDRVHPWSSLRYGLTAAQLITHLMTKTIPKYFPKGAEVQVLSPMHRGSLGTFQLNQLLQSQLNPHRPGLDEIKLPGQVLRVGDRVIQKRNNYDLDVFNGDLGVVEEIDREESSILVRFGLKERTKVVAYEQDQWDELDLAYCMSIHKSQGSEFDIVIIPIVTQHFMMLGRQLLYTGLTRAKKLAIFVGMRRALAMGIKQQKSQERQTFLKERLQGLV